MKLRFLPVMDLREIEPPAAPVKPPRGGAVGAGGLFHGGEVYIQERARTPQKPVEPSAGLRVEAWCRRLLGFVDEAQSVEKRRCRGSQASEDRTQTPLNPVELSARPRCGTMHGVSGG
jgi:hypothetical protein